MERPVVAIGSDKAVAVAVDKGKISQAALKWTVENLMSEGHSLTLVHVRPKTETFNNTIYNEIWAAGGSEVRNSIDGGYKDILDTRVKEMLLPYQSYCDKKNVKNDLVVLEDGDTVGAVAEYVLVNNIDVLVVGAGSRGGIMKKFKGPDFATKISKKVPYFCAVYVVAKGKLQSVKPSSSTVQTSPTENFGSEIRRNSIHSPTVNHQLSYAESSVSSKSSMTEINTPNDFEFRSPLKNYANSDFTFGGFSATESDISFVGSDNLPYDSSFSTSNSSWSVGSFASSQTRSSTSSSEWVEINRLRRNF